jgi:release factor glutamine methyltransferase
MVISAGTIRRWTQPILFRFRFKRGTRRTSTFPIGWTDIQVYPSVFHPKFFGSSMIFGRFIESLDLSGRRFLDMGTGSGIIGLFASRAGADVTSVDINPEAVRCARDNAVSAGMEISCMESDLFGALQQRQFDVIAWNPPFFSRSAGNIDEMAFYAGEGHEVIRRFSRDARNHLTSNGVIYLIFSVDRGLPALEQIFRESAYSVTIAKTERWGLAETMVILEIR